MTRPFYSTKQAAAELGVHTETVKRWARREGIGNKTHPRMWLFTPDDLDRLRELIHPAPGNPDWRKSEH